VKRCTVSAEEFIRRFLQHVLPDHFVKVRYYGLMSPSNRDLLSEARKQLTASRKQAEPREFEEIVKEPKQPPLCPECGREMKLVETLKPQSREPP